MTDDAEQGSGHSLAKAEETTAQRFSALQTQLLCAAVHFFHRHIRSDADVLQRMEGNQMFRLFFEVPYHNKPDLNRIFPESVHDCSALHVCSFILSILHQGIFSVSAFIVSVIYLSRFKESSRITLHACTWRPLFLTSLLLADKMWEDKPVRNSSLAKLFPVLSNGELNRMESEFLQEIKFNVLVKPDLFCSFCEKLLAEQVHQEISHCVIQSEYAATLQVDCEADKATTKATPKEEVAAEKPPDAGHVAAKHPEIRKVNGSSPDGIRPGSWHGEVKRPSVVHHATQAHKVQDPPHAAYATQELRTRAGAAAAPRSVSVQPLRAGEKAEEHVEDPLRGAPASSTGSTPIVVQPPMRRSLPAKGTTTTQYVQLARAPSVGSTAGFVRRGEVAAAPGIQARGAHYPVASAVPMQQSPRSPPPPVPPTLLGHEAPMGQLQGAAYRAQTPTGMPCSQVSSVVAQPVRATPVVAVHSVVQQKPRSSSAPRVSGVVHSQAGANVRASSQPMRQSVIMRQVPQGHAVQAQLSGGHQPCGTRQVMLTNANVQMAGAVGAVPSRVVVTRGTVGGYPTAARNASPAVAMPTSPNCAVCAVPAGVRQPHLLASRGRSVPPVGAPQAGPARPQRSATPTLQSGMAPQVIQRHSMGTTLLQRPGLV
ncbi:ccnyl1 [Symbiodinium natans]|uniref:Ccnyl1 protein n=1 Tax=Symbiodinium natans TaxID=878477 RepID=A0A812R786_9DINO|nr:ccnyl1 [Symbiodinium natans]